MSDNWGESFMDELDKKRCTPIKIYTEEGIKKFILKESESIIKSEVSKEINKFYIHGEGKQIIAESVIKNLSLQKKDNSHICPFCGLKVSYEIGDKGTFAKSENDFAVDCDNCQSIGPFGKTMEEAVKLWKTRV